jgi:hypothetical protein
MRDDRFLGVFFARPRRVLGRLLKPFSMRHRLALEAIGSPFVNPGSRATAVDLILAVRICSLDDPLEAVSGSSFSDWFAGVKMRRRPGLLEFHSAAFADYVEEFSTPPSLFFEPKGGGGKGVHWTLTVATALIEAGFDEERVWTMPEGLAVWYYVAGSIRKGAEMEVLTTEREDELPEVDAAIREAEAKVAATMRKPRAATKPGR